jgi:predicted porin
MKNLIMIIAMILSTIAVKSQNQISALAAQDMRLLITGSETYDSGTFDMMFRVQAEAQQDKHGYASVFFEYERAELTPNYERYSLNASYTLNKLFIKDLELSAYIGYGTINRGFSKQSFGFGGSINYKITDDLKVSSILQLVDRTDLGVLYDDRRIVTSYFLGISYTLRKGK